MGNSENSGFFRISDLKVIRSNHQIENIKVFEY